jgi:hypothetical protein
LNKKTRTALIAVLIVIVLAGAGLGLWFFMNRAPKLVSPRVSQAPKLDGQGNDAVWEDAESIELSVKNGEAVTLKTVHTETDVYFLARYKDETEDAIAEPWEYDGKTWKRGRKGDAALLFFVAGDSIEDFDKRGFEVMDFGFEPGQEPWEFGQTGQKTEKGYWSGYKGRGDGWLMGSATTSPFGQGDDYVYQSRREYVQSPETGSPLMQLKWDGFDTSFMLFINTTGWRESIRLSAEQAPPAGEAPEDQPYMMYKEGMTLKNTPYPFEDQLIEIPEGTSFKKGDKLPWVYFRREEAGRWGGSRDDVTGMMAYADGYWTVEFKRALDTKHGDDIAFKEGDEVTFACLVRSDGKTVRYSEPAVVAFAKGE